jgi:hypothetical protein
MRGILEMRVDEALLAYVNGASGAEAAAIAGMGRAEFFDLASSRNVGMVGERDPDLFVQNLAKAARALGDNRLRRAIESAQTGTET